jgi:hypothetical protein
MKHLGFHGSATTRTWVENTSRQQSMLCKITDRLLLAVWVMSIGCYLIARLDLPTPRVPINTMEALFAKARACKVSKEAYGP